MSDRISWAWLAPLLFAGLPAAAADLLSLERGLRVAIAERDRATLERARRVSEAGGLADDIARLKNANAGPRADPGLEAALKRFDRIARDLDDLDGTIQDRERRVAALKRRFEEEATAESARLSVGPAGGITEVARQLAAIDDARLRIGRLAVGEQAIRPALGIELLPTDGSLDVGQKIALAEAERERLASEQARLDTTAAVAEARLWLKRQLVSELESAARAGGSELALLTRESQIATRSIQGLLREQEKASRQRASLVESLTTLDRQLDEFRRRLKALKGGGERP